MHVCAQDTRPVYHQSFEPFEYFISEGSKAKFNIHPSPNNSLIQVDWHSTVT